LCVSAALDAVKERLVVPWGHPSGKLAADSMGDPSSEPVASTSTPTFVESGPSSDRGSAPAIPSSPPPLDVESTLGETTSNPLPHQRILHRRHFTKALKEITPSSSEFLGTLADLRRWNEEFGEGRTNRRRQVWGKDRFGFTDQGDKIAQEGRVAALEIPSAALTPK
jgi:hypothetical protein